MSREISFNLPNEILSTAKKSWDEMKKIPMEVSAGREDFIEILESYPINVNSNVIMKSFIVFTAVVILMVNSSVIRWDKLNFISLILKIKLRGLFSTKWTFISLLILADCCNALAHIPVILQYIWWEILLILS